MLPRINPSSLHVQITRSTTCCRHTQTNRTEGGLHLKFELSRLYDQCLIENTGS